MSRSARLFDLLQALRRHRYPVTGAALASELKVSVRTIYRDVATLISQGAPMKGEAGLGYVLRPGFLLPPLMLAEDEVEAVMLGLRLVTRQGDPSLGAAATDAAAKIRAVLPERMQNAAISSGLMAGPGRSASATHLPLLRRAVRSERKLRLTYADGQGRQTVRVVWPVALGFFEHARVLVGWCELRDSFRHFRVDRIAEAEALEGRYPHGRAVLLRSWQEQEGIAAQL